MNRLIIVGNVSKDPELRTTPTGKQVCVFNVAVNRRQTAAMRQNNQQPEADFFRVSAWDQMGENCQKYLTKGKKVGVVGAVSVHAYQTSKGEAAATMEVLAQEVEFLSPKSETDGMTKVNLADNPFTGELPY